MSTTTTVLLALVVVGGAAAALWAGPNVSTAAPAAALACLGAVGLAIATFRERLRPVRLPQALVESDTLVLLRGGFESGVLGRRSILASVSALDLAIAGPRHRPLGLDEEERLLRCSPAEFRTWVDRRIAELERIS